VTTEDGTDGSKTYKVNVSDADIKKAVASDLDNKADKNTVTADLANKADKNASNIGEAERTAWAGKLGTGTVAENDANLVTGGKVFAAIKDKADKSELTNKADTSLNTITEDGKTVIK
ncbi:hypothetical protein C3L57_07645, partial [Veillonellaceae bacterium M2-8]|nr:hypothetical protein [Veillonellaceae bacterium M2-8]